MPRQVELAAILLLATLTFISCGDRRPIWSLSAAAVTELELDASTTIEEGRVGDPASGSCRAVLSLRLPNDRLSVAPSPDELRSTLLLASNIQLECIGGCASTDSCKTHHRVDSPDSQWATTGCICDPELPAPCRLDLRWAVGETSRRRIDQIYCVEPTVAATCQILLFRDGADLQITCGSPRETSVVDSPIGR